jgi:hypothetical protein
MPGAFHTEVIPGDVSFKIYLLDVQFKNPTVQGSTASATWVDQGKTLTIPCAPEKNYFNCSMPKGASLRKGTLTVAAKRGERVGNSVVYHLPMKPAAGHSP